MVQVLMILFFVVIIFSNFYTFKFQKSIEGQDERGQLIQLEVNRSLYGLLFLGNIILIVLNLLDILSADQTVELLLYLLLLVSIYGAFLIYRKKKE
jgi:hypothetical protein